MNEEVDSFSYIEEDDRNLGMYSSSAASCKNVAPANSFSSKEDDIAEVSAMRCNNPKILKSIDNWRRMVLFLTEMEEKRRLEGGGIS